MLGTRVKMTSIVPQFLTHIDGWVQAFPRRDLLSAYRKERAIIEWKVDERCGNFVRVSVIVLTFMSSD